MLGSVTVLRWQGHPGSRKRQATTREGEGLGWAMLAEEWAGRGVRGPQTLTWSQASSFSLHSGVRNERGMVSC